MAELEEDDNLALLSDEEESEEQYSQENGVPRVKETAAGRIPVLQKQHHRPSGDSIIKRHQGDLPYSVNENSASESFKIPENRPMHYPKRPPKRKCFTRVRWTLGILMIACLLVLATVGVYLVLSSTDVTRPWWTTAIVYQCYPQSFQDSNDDGLGDLEGIRSRIDHFHDIGVQAVWLNPIFDSPQKDNGYDISNYTSIYSKYGTLNDFKYLLGDLHDKGIRLLLDFVPNHSSDQHPWFIQSRANRTNSKRDWYVWADGVGDAPPNNWLSVFGGSAWTYDDTTRQWYLHQFSIFQPDLNFTNPQVRQAMIDVLRYWLDMGVDGFRVDAVEFLLEDPKLRNESHSLSFNSTDCLNNSEPICYESLVHNLTRNFDGIHDIIKEWKGIINEYSTNDKSILFIGEIYNNVDTVMRYYGNNGDEFNFPFNFFLLDNTDWTGHGVACTVNKWMDNMPTGGTANWVLGNHDNPRIASKAGVYLARALTLLLLTLPGVATSYYGDEILMTDVAIPPHQHKDVFTDRDPERTPMQWDNTTNAGFTNSTPWLPLASNYTTVNVKSYQKNDTSILYVYKQLSALRSSRQSLSIGNYTCINATQELLVYIRHAPSYESFKETLIVIINFSLQNVTTTIDLKLSDTKILLSTHLDKTGEINLGSPLSLRSGEGLIVMGMQTDDSKVKEYINNNKCQSCNNER